MEKARKLEESAQPKPVRSRKSAASPREQAEAWMNEDSRNSMIQRIARLEAALTLTAGTVHDVNNCLTVLTGNLFLLTESVRDQPKLFEHARRARNAAERGSTLLRELLTFNREPDAEAQAISPGNHVAALQPLLARAIGGDHHLELAVDRDTGSVVASAAQFESVLINLVINARDALDRSGTVRIVVRNLEVAEGDATRELKAGSYVCTEIIDDGRGIPEKHLARVTDPLFSTKQEHRGSGLGLTMVKGFAERSDGALLIDSTEGRGTRVSIWLPRSDRPAETTANMTLPLSTLPGGDERLVLMSGDQDVRVSIQQILEVLGYTVLIAEGAEQAEALLMQTPRPVLLISERSSRASSVEQHWLKSLKDGNGELRHIALLQTGTDADEAASDAEGHLYRPVNVSELAQTVRTVLET